MSQKLSGLMRWCSCRQTAHSSLRRLIKGADTNACGVLLVQVLVNGPGTCIPVCAAAFVNRWVDTHSCSHCAVARPLHSKGMLGADDCGGVQGQLLPCPCQCQAVTVVMAVYGQVHGPGWVCHPIMLIPPLFAAAAVAAGLCSGWTVGSYTLRA